MFSPRLCVFVGLIACLLPGPLSAQAVSAKHARVELISGESSVTPGHDLTLGVHFLLEKGWHIYWVNPGDSGQPPEFQWQLPAGLSAGEVEWARPDKLQSSPTLVDYGYRDEVLFIIPVRVPAEWIAPKPLELAVQARWLICREVCIPDHAQLKLPLPHNARGANLQTAPLFAEAEKHLPRPWPKSWSAKAKSRKENFLLALETGKPVSKAEFFPLDKAQIENSAIQRVKATSRGCTITLSKSDLLLKPVSVLRGVLIMSDGQAYQLRVAVNSHGALE